MNNILKLALTYIGARLSEVLIKLFEAIVKSSGAVKEIFQYKKVDIQNKIEERKEQKQKEYEDKVDKITESGTLEDLINLRRKK